MDFEAESVIPIVLSMLVAVGAMAYAWWNADPAKRKEIEQDALRLVAAKLVAEAQLFFGNTATGTQRREWVLTQLKRQYPDFDPTLLMTILEASFAHLQSRQVQAQSRGIKAVL